MCVKTDGSEMSLPDTIELISYNGVSKVWRGHNSLIYKRSLPFLIENELYCLKKMYPSGFVPSAYRYDKYTIVMFDLGESEKVTNRSTFVYNVRNALFELAKHGIRHGDITPYAMIVKNNFPYMIDFAESRLIGDPRPDKRKEGDEYWAERTIDELTKGL